MKIALIRGKYLNKYEMQNYEPLVKRFDITAFSSLKPLHEKFKFPVRKLFSPMGLPNFPLKMPILNRVCLGDAMYLFGLEGELKGFDIAHTRETYFHFTQQALNAKRKGYVKKVLVTTSETIPFNHEGIWRRKTFKKRTIREADHFHCLTQKAKQCLIKEGCNPRKIAVIGYGIDLNQFKRQKVKGKSSRQKLKVVKLLFVSRLVKEKGIYDLLKVFVQLIKEKYKVRLTIIGNGQERTNIINLINQINFKRYIKIKNVSYGRMPVEYQKTDIFVLPSKKTKYWEEYYGMALVEAMVSGLAVAATDCGAIPEVSGGKALISTQGNVKQLYKNILALVVKESLRKKYQKEALKWAKSHFDAKKQARRIGRLYLKVLG